MKKIPMGYGYTKIRVWVAENVSYDFVFRQMDGSYYSYEEQSYTFQNILKNYEKDVYGYHLIAQLYLMDYGLGDGHQENIDGFLFCYNSNYYDDNRIKVWINCEEITGWTTVQEKMGQWFICEKYPQVMDISKATPVGQYIKMKIQTIEMVDKSNFNYLIYRDVEDNKWGLYSMTTKSRGYNSGTQRVGMSAEAGVGVSQYGNIKGKDVGIK